MKLTWEKVKDYAGRYGYIALIIVAMIALAVVIAVGSVLASNSGDTPITDIPTEGQVTTFYDPVAEFRLGKDYNGSHLVYNESLEKWTPHKCVDLLVNDKADVYAVLSGTVTNIDKTYMRGTVVTIDHGDGLVTKYASLENDVPLTVNATVERGQKIGTATISPEGKQLGARLQFSVFKDGLAVDPNNYLSLGEK